MENAKKIATNTFSQVGAKFVIAGLQILIFRAITGYLGKVGYGQYTAVYEFAGLFTIAADFGLFTIGVARITGKTKAEAEKILGSIFTLRLLLVAAVTIAATISAFFLPSYTPAMRWGVLIASLANCMYLVMLTISSVLQVQLRMTRNALDQIIGRVVMLVLVYSIVKVWTGDTSLGLIALFSAGLIGNFISTVLTGFAIRKEAKLRLNFDWASWKDLLSSSLPYGISLVLGVIYLRIGTPILNHLGSDADVGLYGIGLKIYDLIVVLPFAFMNSVLPALTRNLKNHERLSTLTQYSVEFLATIGFAALGGVLVLADGVINFLAAGQDFSGAENNLRIMMLAMLLNFFISLFSYLLLALRQEKRLLIYNACAAILSVGINIWFIKSFEQKSLATACAVIIPQSLVLMLTGISAIKELKLKLSLVNPIKIVISASIMTLSLWWLDIVWLSNFGILRLLIGIPLGALIYLIALILLGAIHPDAIELLLKRKAKINGPITIGMDIRSFHAAKTGKEWYTVSLLESLMKVDHENNYVLYTKYPVEIPNLPNNFKIREIRAPIVFWHIAVVFDLWKSKTHVWLATASYIIPALLINRRPRSVTVVHDLVAFLKSNRHLKKALMIERFTLRQALRHSAKVIAVSKNTAEDLRRFFPSATRKVSIIPEAARKSFKIIKDTSSIHETQQKYGLPNEYILFVGTLEPRKNLPRLIRAYASISTALQKRYPLVIVGKKGWYYEEIFQTVKELELVQKVHFTGYMPDDDLPAILNGATLFVLPSLYEGFGLPLLEAFACGTPVITSDTPALVEVAGEGCVTVNPTDEADIAKVLEQVLTDDRLRQDMRTWGIERVSSFSWENAAINVHQLLLASVEPSSSDIAVEPSSSDIAGESNLQNQSNNSV